MCKYILFIILAAAPGWAAITTAPRKGPEGNRVLFIVDTSSSMKRMEHAGRQVVYDMVYSGVQDRMQPGDTFGVWTFGNEVKAGVFPVQVWTPEKSTDLAGQVGRFLKEHSNGRSSRLEAAITNAEAIVKNVRDVDVFIITSSAARFKADESWGVLQQTFKTRAEEAKKTNKAMIVALAARGGRIGQAIVAIEGERIDLIPPPSRKPAPVAQAAPAPVPPPPKVAREPILMRGTQKATPIDEIPTRFNPPPAPTPAVEPAPDPFPEPNPVPVVPQKPLVVAPPAPEARQPERPGEPQPPITVSAREPGKLPAPVAPLPAPASSVTISARMLIIIGATLVLMAAIIAVWMLAHLRARNRASYISQSMAHRPGDRV